jgi:hypothetical protein
MRCRDLHTTSNCALGETSRYCACVCVCKYSISSSYRRAKQAMAKDKREQTHNTDSLQLGDPIQTATWYTPTNSSTREPRSVYSKNVDKASIAHNQTKQCASFIHDRPSARRANGNRPEGAMCVRNLSAQCVCNSRYITQLAAFFIDPRAE